MAWYDHLTIWGKRKLRRQEEKVIKEKKKEYKKQPFMKHEVETMTGTQKKRHKALSRSLSKANYDIKKEPTYQAGSDYINRILSGDPEALKQFEAPHMRRFKEQIVPQLASQFSMANNQSGSAFQRALSDSAADLEERMAYLRGNLQQNASNQALQYAQQPVENAQQRYNQLQQFSPRQNVLTQKPVPGQEQPSGVSQFAQPVLSALGTGLGYATAGPIGGAIGGSLGSALGSSASSSPAPQQQPQYGSGFMPSPGWQQGLNQPPTTQNPQISWGSGYPV